MFYWKRAVRLLGLVCVKKYSLYEAFVRPSVCFLTWITFHIPSPYRAVNTFHLGYKNQSVYALSGTGRCLFSDKYKTHKYSVDRAYSCSMLDWWCITRPVGCRRLIVNLFLIHNNTAYVRTLSFNYCRHCFLLY